jgi:hypothetical protein
MGRAGSDLSDRALLGAHVGENAKGSGIFQLEVTDEYGIVRFGGKGAYGRFPGGRGNLASNLEERAGGRRTSEAFRARLRTLWVVGLRNGPTLVEHHGVPLPLFLVAQSAARSFRNRNGEMQTSLLVPNFDLKWENKVTLERKGRRKE